jgi:hypothetical protein
VEDFFASYPRFHDQDGIQRYVEWTIPTPRVEHTARGWIIMKEDHAFPYLYRYDGDDVAYTDNMAVRCQCVPNLNL